MNKYPQTERKIEQQPNGSFDIMTLDIRINNSFDMPFKIILDSNFPQSTPRIFANSKMTHPLIDSKMFEINWLSLGKWDANGRKSKISGVIGALKHEFEKQEPTIE